MMKNDFFVNDDYVNSRFDRWFKKNVCNVPQSLIEKNIRKGKIKINNKKIKSSYKLKKNDKITIFNLNFSPNKNKKLNKYIPTSRELSDSTSIFIENNENFVVLNKPAGLAVQPGTKSRRNILDILRGTKEFNDCLPYAVHRIDKDTTGILIVAKNRKYAQLFTSLFRIRKIHKIYLGIVIGQLKTLKGTLIDDLYEYKDDKKITNKAITHFTVIDSNGKYSFLKIVPESGRKHQIRKQLLIQGNPILGDSKYRILDRIKNKKNDLMLHAYKINFSIAGLKYSFTAEPPVNFLKTLKEKYLKTSQL